MRALGIDTSNYTTSAAVFDGTAGRNAGRLLDVRPGELGLRQSDALFQHVKHLPDRFAELEAEGWLEGISVVGASTRPRAVEGSYMQGVYTVLALVGLGLLILLYGAVRNSATRYIWAMANHEDRPVRREIRRRLRGRRMAQLGTALCNLLLCVPFLWLAALQLKDTFLELCQQLVLAMSWNGRPQISPDVVKTLLPLTLTFFLTYMPLLPARRILTAAFAVREPRHTAPRNGQPVEEDPTLPKAIVPDWVRAENEENGASDRSADA